MDVYRAFASTPGIERHHIVGKRVHGSIHGDTGEGNVDRQVAASHNDQQIGQEISFQCHSFELFLTQCSHAKGESADNRFYISCDGQDDETDVSDVLCGEEFLDEEMSSLEAALTIAGGLRAIGDGYIFASDL